MIAPHISAFISLAFMTTLKPIIGAPTYLMPRQVDEPVTVNPNATPIQKQNGLAAQKLNAQFANMTANDSCQAGGMACINEGFAQCVSGKWTVIPCAASTICVALPLVNSEGTSLSCAFEQDAIARFAAAGVEGGLTGNGSGNDSDGGDNGDEDCDDVDDDNDEDGNDPEECEDDEDNSTSTTATATVSSVTPSASVALSPGPAVVVLGSGVTSSVPSPSVYPRQVSVIGSGFTVSPSSAVSSPSLSPSPVSTASTPAAVASAENSATFPTTTIAATPSPATQTGEPTSIFVGTDGLATVTVVSVTTVTVGCGPSSAATATATATDIVSEATATSTSTGFASPNVDTALPAVFSSPSATVLPTSSPSPATASVASSTALDPLQSQLSSFEFSFLIEPTPVAIRADDYYY